MRVLRSVKCTSLTIARQGDAIKQLFDSCIHFYRRLQATADSYYGNNTFQQETANTQYYYSLSLDEVEGLEKVGVKSIVDGKDREQMLEELLDLDQQVPEWEHCNTCRALLFSMDVKWEYAASILFIALPSDLDAWDDSNSTTHHFRLYFLCDNRVEYGRKDDVPQHVHLSNHPGYAIKRQQEFFQHMATTC